MYDAEESFAVVIESDDEMLHLEETEIMIGCYGDEIGLDCKEFRASDDGKRAGNSLEVYLTRDQVAMMAQVISDWLNSREQASFDKYIGEVTGTIYCKIQGDIEEMEAVELRMALDERGIFLTPGTVNDYPEQIRIPENSRGSTENISRFKNILLDSLEMSSENEEENVEELAQTNFDWDIFICHSSADKDSIVNPLTNELKDRGLDVWYDDFEIHLGDDIRQAIEKGIKNSRYGVIVLSENFMDANWAETELSTLTSREHSEEVDKILLPIRYNIDMERLRNEIPLLASRHVASISENDIEETADKICKVVIEP